MYKLVGHLSLWAHLLVPAVEEISVVLPQWPKLNWDPLADLAS